MKIAAIARQSCRSLRRYTFRSLLMISGVVVGISSLAVLTSIGENTRRETMERMKNMVGTFDTVIVRPGGGRSRGMPTLVNVPPTLTFDDALAIESQPGIKAIAEVQNAFDIDVKYRNRTSTPAIFGVSPNWLVLRSEAVEEGSFFSAQQNNSLARFAVIGSDVRRDLFPDEDPIGKLVRIADVPFQIIGTLRSRGAGPAGGSLDDLILIPIDTAARRLFNRDYLTMLIVQLEDPSRSDALSGELSNLLRERHNINPPALDDFTLTNPRATMAQINRAGSTFTKVLTGISVMSLLIAGIVITGLTSIGVSERRREIGIRRSAGAMPADIAAQFLLEATLVAVLGGILGAAIGAGGAQSLARVQHLPGLLLWRPLFVSFFVSIILGIAFGTYPAIRAAKVNPIEVLRG